MILGFGPCHHMKDVLQDPARGKAWIEVYRTRSEGRKPKFGEVLGGYGASVEDRKSVV